MFAALRRPMATRTTTPAAEFSIPVHDLDAGGRDFQLPVRAAWLRGVLEGTDVGATSTGGELRVRLSKSGSDVVLLGSLDAEMTVACSRCLEPTPVRVHEDFSVLAVPASPARTAHAQRGRAPRAERSDAKPRRPERDDEDGIEPQEADVIPYDGETVVLDDLVRDELLLALPMIPLCSESCPGISPKPDDGAGAADPDAHNVRVDPRLLPLLELKKKT
jgi:uncharacterized protein